MQKRNPQTIINQIESLLRELRSSLTIDTKEFSGSFYRNPEGLTGNIHNLIEEGFFDQPRTLSEIHEKLRVEGINKPMTSLMKPLLRLIKGKELKRERQEKGQFHYQRR